MSREVQARTMAEFAPPFVEGGAACVRVARRWSRATGAIFPDRIASPADARRCKRRNWRAGTSFDYLETAGRSPLCP